MFAGQFRAACRWLSTFPSGAHSQPLVATIASGCAEVRPLHHDSHLVNHPFVAPSHSPLVTRHCLRLPNRHTRWINFPRNSSAINKSSHSNRHIKRHDDYAPLQPPREIRRLFRCALPPLHISNVKATMDNWAWWKLRRRIIPANRGFSNPRPKDFHSRYPWTSTQRSL